ncbi:MAG: adenosylcobinamide-GDP ribazoletransferase [Cytophagales bacterium]|nr:adenosylcobinamide-GDP ribazoletransferase [Cytophagales bacterium]
MKHEIRVFFTALMFYTRIPCPSWVDHDENYINKATRYFPLIGWIVGTLGFAGYYLSSLFLSVESSIVISMICTVLTTGAFHEDGFADVCDGFGGGWTKEKILSIMKDSRVGAYGVIGLILIFTLKFSLLVQLVKLLDVMQLFVFFILGHTLSRFFASLFILTHAYVRDLDESKSKPIAKSVAPLNFIIGGIIALVPLIGFLVVSSQPWYALVIIPLYLTKIYLGRYFTKWIGGYTGDCLGATQQIMEVIIYLSFLAIWKFI